MAPPRPSFVKYPRPLRVNTFCVNKNRFSDGNVFLLPIISNKWCLHNAKFVTLRPFITFDCNKIEINKLEHVKYKFTLHLAIEHFS